MRYLGRVHGYFPTDAIEQLKVNYIMDCAADLQRVIKQPHFKPLV